MYHREHKIIPAFWYAIALILGIAIAHYGSHTQSILLGACNIFILFWVIDMAPKYRSFLMGLSCMFCAGMIVMHKTQKEYDALTHLYHHTRPYQCTVISYQHIPHLFMPHRLIVCLHEYHSPCLMIHTHKNYQFLVGSTINIENITIKPPKKEFAFFCQRNGFVGSICQPHFSYTLINYPNYSLYRTLNTIRHSIIHTFKKQLSPRSFILFSALFLGATDEIKQELKPLNSVFQRWGIVHYLARSGLHVMLVTLIIEWLISCFLLPLTISRIFVILIGLFYWICSWPTISFYRALLLFCITHLCIMQRTFFHFFHFLCIICIVFLLSNPLHIFFLDFQLTFGLTGLLALCNTNNKTL